MLLRYVALSSFGSPSVVACAPEATTGSGVDIARHAKAGGRRRLHCAHPSGVAIVRGPIVSNLGADMLPAPGSESAEAVDEPVPSLRIN